MISTLHTFGRDLKWNPHIHVLVPEVIYDRDKDEVKHFHHFDFAKLRKTFQFELLRLMEEVIGPSFKRDKNTLYKRHDNGFCVYAKYMEDNDEFNQENNSDNINACVNYCMRYASRPTMAESRITSFDSSKNTVSWFYHRHEDDTRVDVCDDVISFINKLIIHIPDHHFHYVRYYGFYASASQKDLNHIHTRLSEKQKKDNSKESRSLRLTQALHKLHYRTHLIDSFNRDPLKCSWVS